MNLDAIIDSHMTDTATAQRIADTHESAEQWAPALAVPGETAPALGVFDAPRNLGEDLLNVETPTAHSGLLGNVTKRADGTVESFLSDPTGYHYLTDGAVLDGAASVETAYQESGLAWGLEQIPCMAHDRLADGKVNHLPTGRLANIRSDSREILGFVSPGYKAFDNRELFSMVSQTMGADAEIDSAGSVDGGKGVWIAGRLAKSADIGGAGDRVDSYALFHARHDGSGSVSVLPITRRIVCANMLNYLISSAQKAKLRIPHRGNLAARVREARRVLGVVIDESDRMYDRLRSLSGAHLSAEQLSAYFDALYPTDPKVIDPTIAQWRPYSGGRFTLDQAIANEQASADEREIVASLASEATRKRVTSAERKARANRAALESIMGNLERERERSGGMPTGWHALNAVTEYVDHQEPRRGKDDADRQHNRFRNRVFGEGADFKVQATELILETVNA